MSTFPGFSDLEPLELNLSEQGAAQLVSRVLDGSFDAFAQAAASVGHCAHPVRLSGSSTTIDAATGEVLNVFSSADAPLGVLVQRCGNRRVRVCPSCSRLYARDMFEVIRTGVTGGKTVPGQVADNPLLFVTLTAPSFGHVHGTRHGGLCRPRRQGSRVLCEHGRPTWCRRSHADADPVVGEPFCFDCYRYTEHVVWQWWAPELWRRFTIALGRGLAARLGTSPHGLKQVACVQYAKVAEVQARGAVHYHALIRLDGPASEGIGAPAPAGITAQVFAELVKTAAAQVRYTAPPALPGMAHVSLGFGRQVDVKVVRTGHRQDDPNGVLTPGQVAGYLAKYATKDATDTAHAKDGSAHLRRITATCHHIGAQAKARDSLRRRGITTPDTLGVPVDARGRDVYLLAGKWARELGYRGHFATKSRRYSLTLGALRRARARFQTLTAQAARRGEVPVIDALELLAEDADDHTTIVLKRWEYDGTGWDHNADTELALAAAARAREYAQWKANRRCSKRQPFSRPGRLSPARNAS